MIDKQHVARLCNWIEHTKDAVVFTGAGISTDSGVPDFRGSNGLWKDRAIEKLATPEGLRKDFRRFTEFYRWRIHNLFQCEPNRAHRILAEWQENGLVGTIVTQNVDGFHHEAARIQGIEPKVIELHGSLRTVRCDDCGREATSEAYLLDGGEYCSACRGPMRPNVVLFGEAVKNDLLVAAAQAAGETKLFLALGSSLTVHPAARIPEVALKFDARVAIVNDQPTPFDKRADWVGHYPITECLEVINEFMRAKWHSEFAGS